MDEERKQMEHALNVHRALVQADEQLRAALIEAARCEAPGWAEKISAALGKLYGPIKETRYRARMDG
ncbi:MULTISPECIES: hypothetical protein [Halorhodospira]|uniref:hypothetical protein n=1 Tax=Halorhodospira TaxID=85108 RepID=UPI001EE8E0D3|nr:MULTISPECIES: hypothetical protein [Halorhodospira]MCG5527345.1 hypothetical protein [Halorhodospira halophila]MCG5543661.1 hypothetical protein [Halorhodospira sp. 9628]